MIFEVAHHMALVPLAALVVRSRDAGYWWLAVAFGISWVADSASHVMDAALVGYVYPVSQAGLVYAVLTTRKAAAGWFVLMLGWTVLCLVLDAPDIWVRLLAWGVIVGLAVPFWELGLLRVALVTYYGLGLLAWLAYSVEPDWDTWGAYQVTRALGIAIFVVAVFRERNLRLVRVR